MMKNLTWPIIVVIISVILTAIVVFSGIILIEIDKVTSAKAVTVELQKEEIDNGIVIETADKEAEYYTSKISMPITDVKEIDETIESWVKTYENSFMQDMITLMESKKVLEEDENNHLAIMTDYFKVNDAIYTFILRGSLIENDQEINSFEKTFTVNLEKETVFDLEDTINLDDSFKKLLKQEANKNDLINEFDEEKLEQAMKKEELNWALTDEAIVFFFKQNELGEHVDTVELAVAYVDAHESLTDTFYAMVITDEMQKVINASPRELDPDGKYIALTFDDGPDELVTPRILETLKEYDAKATFYMLGRNAVKNPHIAQMVVEDGHEIANHSITHPNLNAVSAQAIKDELTVSQEQIEEATGVKPTSFRPPYGEYNNLVLEQARATEQIVTMWTIDTMDWQSKNTNAIVNKVSMSSSGDIVLMHDIHSTTADALPVVMDYLQKEGFEFITVSEMLQFDEHIEVGPYYGTKNDYNEQAY